MVGTKSCPVDFDHFSADYADNWMKIFRDIRSTCPVAWTGNYGGFWILSRYDDVLKVARDDTRFSVAKSYTDTGEVIGGALIPPFGPTSVPFELDPPEHRKYRALFAPLLTPEAVRALEPSVRALVDEAIDRVIERGTCDMMLDIAELVPAYLTCQLLGLEKHEAPRLLDVAHKAVYVPPSAPEFAEVLEGMAWLGQRITQLIAERRDAPGDDVISYFVHAEVDGKQVSEERAAQMITQLIFGGVDTTGSFTSTAIKWLHDNPEKREWLRDNPDRIPNAVEELLRYFSTAHYAARTVVEPVEIGGQRLDAGDRVMMSWAAANHDPARFADPDEVDLERSMNHHMTFGVGAHTCMGLHLGKLQARTMLAEILRRMPDYALIPGASERYTSIGTINGWVKLPASFTPGPRVG